MSNHTQEPQSQQGAAPPPPPSSVTPPPGGHSPARAAICALIPGIGAVCNREYIKAVLHFSIFAGLCLIAGEVGIFGLAATAFYIFTIIDAYRSAEIIVQRKSFASEGFQNGEINMPLWGGVLVLMGILFLLDNLGLIYFRAIVQFWPIIFIFLGLYLIFDYYRKTNSRDQAARTSSRSRSSESFRERSESSSSSMERNSEESS